MPNTWNDIVKDWEKIPLNAYEFIFVQVKERYEETMSESESITNKTLKVLGITGLGLSAFVGFKFVNNPGMEWIVLLSFLYILDFICIGILLFPKKIVQRGSPPNEIFIDYLDKEDLKENEKTALIYYHELKRYQDRIDTMGRYIYNRQIIYGIALALTIITTIITSGVILSTIYPHPLLK